MEGVSPTMKKRTKTNIILAICVILLLLIPFIFVKGEYGGSDDQGTEQIKKLMEERK